MAAPAGLSSGGTVGGSSIHLGESNFAEERVVILTDDVTAYKGVAVGKKKDTISTAPFTGFFVRYCRTNTGAQTIVKVRFGKQGGTQKSGWITIGEGFSCQFSGMNQADVIEVSYQFSNDQPSVSVSAPTAVCFILIAGGYGGAGAGA